MSEANTMEYLAHTTLYTTGSSYKRQGEPGYMYMALFSVCKQTQTDYQLHLKTVAHSLILKFP